MKISKAGITFIEKEEGFRKKAYLDSVGIWTIGYGTIRIDGRPVTKADVCTKEEATKWLMDHIKVDIEPPLNSLVQVPVTQNNFDALCSFVYNLGIGALSRSTLLKKLNAKDYPGAGNEFLKWNKGTVNGVLTPIKGLTLRRERERALFLSSVDYS